MSPASTDRTYDAVIVGSGAGGAAASYALSRAGLEVLLLEKGAPLPRDGSTLDDECVVTRGEFLSKEPWIDGRGGAICPEEHFNLGGKTKWYGAAVLRYSPREFTAEPDYAARGWPIAYDDLAPYYEEAERLLGVRTFPCEPGLARILERLSKHDAGWQSAPLPMALSAGILNDRREATHFDGFASVANLKGDAEENFLKAVGGRANFTLRTDAEVVALLPAPDAASATGVAPAVGGVRLAGGEELHARLVLLAAGALHSPRLLRRYLAAHGADSRAAAPDLAGRNLKKHVLTAMVAVSFYRQHDLLRKTMFTTHGAFPHSSVQPLGFDAELIATLIPKIVPRFIANIVSRRAYGFFLQTEDGSHPDNRVLERGQPPVRIMDYDEARLPASQSEHRAFTRAFRRSLLRAGMIGFTQRTGLNGTAHAGGTLVAGADAGSAVVDARGAVFGIEGLYVVDGSILPRSSRVNPSLSIFAWGLRVADHLVKSNR
jgi:choline dehydrogenase-like flavoprotein